MFENPHFIMNASKEQHLLPFQTPSSQQSSMKCAIEGINDFLQLQGTYSKTNKKLFKRYVCRSIYQENLGMVDGKLFDKIIHGKTSADETLLYQDTLNWGLRKGTIIFINSVNVTRLDY